MIPPAGPGPHRAGADLHRRRHLSSLPTLRLATWPHDPTIGLITVADHESQVEPDELGRLVQLAMQRGCRLVRTGALRPGPAAAALAAGFDIIDELLLLSHALEGVPVERRHRVRPLRRRHLHCATSTDLNAFGPRWTHDVAAINEAISATPRARAARVPRADAPVAGYAVSGVSGATGYVQRLAVDPSAQRLGIGRSLINDALAWMCEQRVDRALVNTSVTNQAAIAMYRSIGFVPCDDVLVVAELDPSVTRR